MRPMRRVGSHIAKFSAVASLLLFVATAAALIVSKRAGGFSAGWWSAETFREDAGQGEEGIYFAFIALPTRLIFTGGEFASCYPAGEMSGPPIITKQRRFFGRRVLAARGS